MTKLNTIREDFMAYEENKKMEEEIFEKNLRMN